MTVIATSYSSIDEVWADSYLSPSLQKPKSTKKKNKSNANNLPPMKDPICELYETGTHTLDDADLVSFANKYFESHGNGERYDAHSKARYQIPRMEGRDDQPKVVDIDVHPQSSDMLSAPVRDNIPPKQHHRKKHHTDDDDSDYSSDSEEDTYRYNSRHKDSYDVKESFEDDMFGRKNSSFGQIDLILYIISGIILIFMMDQFVKIGLLLQ